MLHKNEIKPIDLEAYRSIAPEEQCDELTKLAESFQGKRLAYVSSTASGGGVAEMLHPAVALYRGLGVDIEWQTIEPPPGFFEATKQLHNALQGSPAGLTEQEWNLYESVNRDLAKELKALSADAVIVHDPQPAAARHFLGIRKEPWIWRCHIDLSSPNQTASGRFAPYLQEYDGAVYSMEGYELPGFDPGHEAIIAPIIDPLSPKNLPMNHDEAEHIVSQHGIDSNKPLLTQVSRFDPWKDPVGVIAAWERAVEDVPDLQLALVGNTVNDDPESLHILQDVKKAAAGKNNIRIIENLPPAENERGVKAFYVASDIVIQKSTREGFGLTISEALWAKRPVIGGNVGGITLQIQDGKSGYLVDSIESAAEAIVKLMANEGAREKMGNVGHEYVGQHFLLPRLLVDELTFLNGILDS